MIIGGRRNRRRPGMGPGMGLIEMMISLTIAALLLVGVAAAFSATSRVVQNNDEFTRAAQSARVSVNQIITRARQCQSATVAPTALEVKLPDDTRQLYSLDAVNHQLKVTLESKTPPEVYTLARNVTALRFTSGADGTSITMRVTIKVGENEVMLSGSTVPRRLVQYK
jgi:type II secretory pathway pseudopilin PulG